jgi:hypothetical protein
MSCILTNCDKESSELCLVDDLARSQPLVSPWVLIPVVYRVARIKLSRIKLLIIEFLIICSWINHQQVIYIHCTP